MLSSRLSLKISEEIVVFKRIRQIFCLHSFEFERVEGGDPRDHHYLLTCRKCGKEVERFL